MSSSALPPLQWIESGGGPLILLPARLIESWTGVPPDAWDAIAGDYARAVGVRDYLGIIDVGKGEALVLGGDPMPATLLGETTERLSIIRWMYADSDEAAIHVLSVVDGLPYRPEPFLFEHDSDQLVLMDAAHPGKAIGDTLVVPLKPGTYAVATAEFSPDPDTSFVIHRLELL